jgi:translation initiation factor IF-2
VDSESTARKITEARSRLGSVGDSSGSNGSQLSAAQKLLLEAADGDTRGNLSEKKPKVVKVPIVLKADSSSSIEAITTVISEISTKVDDDEVKKFNIIYSGVGDVSTADIALASSNSVSTSENNNRKPGIVVGYNVGAIGGAVALAAAKNKNIQMCMSPVIYHIVQELTDLLSASEAPPLPGTLLGRASVLKVFNVGKSGKVAGCVVKEGAFTMPAADPAVVARATEDEVATTKNVKVRVIRNKKDIIVTGDLTSLRIEKKTVTEVLAGSECGIAINKFTDFMEGDIIECFEVEQPATLAP